MAYDNIQDGSVSPCSLRPNDISAGRSAAGVTVDVELKVRPPTAQHCDTPDSTVLAQSAFIEPANIAGAMEYSCTSPTRRRVATPIAPSSTSKNLTFNITQSPIKAASTLNTPNTNTNNHTSTRIEMPTKRATNANPSNEKAPQPGAYYALCILILMNLVNFADRFVPSACKSLIQVDLHLSDMQSALPSFAFLLVYMLTAPIFGSLADGGRLSRVRLIMIGLFLWSLATVAGAFAQNFTQFLLARAAVGIGEGAFATIAPALLCDYFTIAQRPRIMSWFYLVIPCGAAIGYGVSGHIGHVYGWRSAFFVCGMPGMVLVLFALGMTEPVRGLQDKTNEIRSEDGVILLEEDTTPVSWAETISSLCLNRMYMYALVGMTLCSFASGGIADWLPTWLTRVQGLTIGEAGIIFGGITCIAGVVGSLSGYKIGEQLVKKGYKNPYFCLSSWTQLGTGVTATIVLTVGSEARLSSIIILLLACQFLLWLNAGGCSAVIATSVHPRIRSRAFGVSILISHLGGDALSPTLIGCISDAYGGNLTIGLAIVPCAFLLAAIVFTQGARTIRDGRESVTIVRMHRQHTRRQTYRIHITRGTALNLDRCRSSARMRLSDCVSSLPLVSPVGVSPGS